tara:strand:- start:172 stop:1311 length:1140 start_codon:yes stop_codon:yes gene_type:complete
MTKAAELAKMGEVLTNSQIGGRRNIVINGAMQVAQRGTSATNPGGGYNTLDRWRFTQNSSGLGNFTAEQSTDVPSGEGFKSSLKMTNGDAKTITTTMTCYIETKFEGQDVQQLKYGTSSAENVTLSFFVRSSVTGTFCCHLFQEGNNKAHVKEYTISSANTFEKKTLTFTGDTATSLANDNTAELNIGWVLGSGSDAQISADSWASVPSAKGYCTSNQTNWITTNGATFYITGVQLEVGSQATPFEHRSFAEELALCQRYCVQIVNTENGSAHIILAGMSRGSTNKNFTLPLPVTMRNTTPSVTLTGDVRLLNPEAHDFVNATDTLTCGGVTPTLVYMGNMLGLLYTGSVTDVTDTTNADYNFQIVSASDHLFIIDSEL